MCVFSIECGTKYTEISKICCEKQCSIFNEIFIGRSPSTNKSHANFTSCVSYVTWYSLLNHFVAHLVGEREKDRKCDADTTLIQNFIFKFNRYDY